MAEIPRDLSAALKREFTSSEGGPVQFLIDTYNRILIGLPKMFGTLPVESRGGAIEFVNPVVVPHMIEYKSGVQSPMFPDECVASDQTYMAPMYITIRRGNDEIANIPIGKLPVMVRSDLCNLTRVAEETDVTNEQDCKYNPGGYFIVAGMKKVIAMQEKLQLDQDVVYLNRAGRIVNQMICTDGALTRQVLLIAFAVKKATANEPAVPTIRLVTDTIRLIDPQEHKNDPGINVGVIYRLLGVTDKQQALDYIIGNFIPEKDLLARALVRAYLLPTFDIAQRIVNPVDELISRDKEASRIPNQRKQEAVDLALNNLFRDLFPQIPASSVVERINLLSYMIIRLVLVAVKIRKPDDRNVWKYKYVQTSPAIMGMLLAKIWYGVVQQLQIKVNEYEDKARIIDLKRVQSIVNTNAKITEQLVQAIRTGKWGTKSSRSNWTGITEDLNQMSMTAMWSHLTRINTPSEKSGTQFPARMNQGSQTLGICFIQTPDSEACGLTKNLASTSSLTLETDPNIVWALIEILAQENPGILTNDKTFQTSQLLLLNGRPRGWCSGERLYKLLLVLRRTTQLHPTTSLALRESILIIKTNAGRMYAPLMIVENGEMVLDKFKDVKMSFADMLKNGVVEYIDSLELEDAVIAQTIEELRSRQHNRDEALRVIENARERLLLLGTPEEPPMSLAEFEFAQSLPNPTPEEALTAYINQVEKFYDKLVTETNYTHVMMEPTAIYGIAGASIPYANTMQAARGTYAANQFTQRISNMPIPSKPSFQKSSKTLLYGETPLVYTEQDCALGLDQYPAGSHLTVAIMPYEGNNQEDAIIMNRESLDKMRQSISAVVSTSETDTRGIMTQIYRPLAKVDTNGVNVFGKLESDGIIGVGSKVNKGDCLIGLAEYAKTQQVEMNTYFDLLNRIHDLQDQMDAMIQVNQPPVVRMSTEPRVPQEPKNNPAIFTTGPVPEVVNQYKAVINEFQSQQLDPPSQRAAVLNQLQTQITQLKSELSRLSAPNNVSVYATKKETGYVTNVLITNEEAGHLNRLVKIKIVKMHRFDEREGMGDKYTNRHAQKVTIGSIRDAVNMPFTASGRIVDAIINPTCVPSRMTPGMLKEMIMSQINALFGTRTNATAFRDEGDELQVIKNIAERRIEDYYLKSERDIINALHDGGMNFGGLQEVFNPATGEMLKARIYVGPLYYHALKHQVADKIRAHGYNPAVDIKGSSVKGNKQKDPGLRFGEMERDAIIAHGASGVLLDRLVNKAHVTVWCLKCGVRAVVLNNPMRFMCRKCKENHFAKVSVPASFIYGSHLFETLGITMRLNFSNNVVGSGNTIVSAKTLKELTRDIETRVEKETGGESGRNFVEISELDELEGIQGDEIETDEEKSDNELEDELDEDMDAFGDGGDEMGDFGDDFGDGDD